MNRGRIAAGKGGVGKSTTIASFGMAYTKQGKKTLTIDMDGGKALSRVLGINPNQLNKNDINKTEINGMYIGSVQKFKYISVNEFKEKGGTIQEYFEQFPEDYGLIPLCDMVTNFFGIPSPTHNLTKFLTLTKILEESKNKKFEKILIDIEPTEGLENLLTSMNEVQKTIKNLQNKGKMFLFTIGAKWPDIKAYLQDRYIESGEYYGERIFRTSQFLKNSNFTLVCKPESGPIEQMQTEVKSLVNSIGANISNYAINDVRGETYELKQISKLKTQSNGAPIIEFKHDVRICDGTTKERRKALTENGLRLLQ